VRGVWPCGEEAGGDQAVKRNMERFPQDFMFRLTEEEWDALAQKISMSSQIVMTYPEKRPKKATPYAFTEHGASGSPYTGFFLGGIVFRCKPRPD